MCPVFTGQAEQLLSSNSQKPVRFKLDEVMNLHLEVVMISSDAAVKLRYYAILRVLGTIGIISNIPDNHVPTSKPSLSLHFIVVGST